MSRKGKRRTRKHRRALKARFGKGDPGPRHTLTAGRTGKVHYVKNKSRHNAQPRPSSSPEVTQ